MFARATRMLTALLGLQSALLAQREPPVVPPAPPTRSYRGPGDVTPPGVTAPAPALTAPTPAPAGSAPRPKPAPPRPQHLRQVPEHIARALQRYGTPITFEHERTAKSRLTYAWESVLVMPPAAEGPTVAAARAKALPFADAVALLADGDPRPLLVLRESWPLGAADQVEMDRKLDNEKTILLAKWFRCVSVADSVRHADHPLHSLFTASPAPRLVLCAADGGHLTGFAGSENLSRLWAAMIDLLGRHVDGDCVAAVHEEMGILSRFDHLDSMETEFATRLDRLLESAAPSQREITQLRARLAELQRERTALEALERKVMGLLAKPAKVAKRP